MIENLVWLILCIYFEARGEDVESQVAVGHVVLNRTIKDKVSVKRIVTKPWQFSWMNTNTPPAIKDYAALIKCAESALICAHERLEGKTLSRSDHYFDDSIDPPYWVKNMKLISKIGVFTFYRE